MFSDKDLVLTLNEYGNFEKVGSLGETLPRNDTHIKTNPGDIVLYNGDNISIFYNSNSWSYTYLGKIVNKTQEELIELFGRGDIEIRFSNK